MPGRCLVANSFGMIVKVNIPFQDIWNSNKKLCLARFNTNTVVCVWVATVLNVIIFHLNYFIVKPYNLSKSPGAVCRTWIPCVFTRRYFFKCLLQKYDIVIVRGFQFFFLLKFSQARFSRVFCENSLTQVVCCIFMYTFWPPRSESTPRKRRALDGRADFSLSPDATECLRVRTLDT